MGLRWDWANPFDYAVWVRLEAEGARHPEIVHKEPLDMPDPRVWRYVIRAESWKTKWRYEDGDPNADEQIRQFESRADRRGTTHATRYGEAPS
jgi:hypothetical protein